MRDAFSPVDFAKITQFGPTIVKSLIGRHPESFLRAKFQTTPVQLQHYVNDRLSYCYPTIRGVALKYAIRQAVIEKFGIGGVGDFISDEVGAFLQKIGGTVHNEYATKPDEVVFKEFESVPIEFKLDNDVLALNTFNLCHRIDAPDFCPLNDSQIATRILDVLFSVYSVSYLLSSAEDIYNSASTPALSKTGVVHLSKGSFQAKQLIFAAIFRIRSAWDKLLFNLLAESYDVSFKSRDGYLKKLDKLLAAADKFGEHIEPLVEGFIKTFTNKRCMP